ncbi:hypothetical protein Sjap_012442 [Stephania japonica]|uniref:TF-B3 domain-containing protein n=1 Tax=Stephania japonica TaxID=461633 RepID=A0AAP0IWS0_9MAGN
MMIITSPTPNTNQKPLFLHHHPSTPSTITNMKPQQQRQQTLTITSSSSSLIDNHINIDDQEDQEREQMFEKPLTPSDVGKLNRLVIPKQHAEKYFPLDRVDSAETTALLSFEDESGKSWKFRYSYWNSSQSYVLTKGWSRFVKEKRLDAGDIVSFQRRPLRRQHLDDDNGRRFFIRWRRGGSRPIHDDNPMLTQMCFTTTAPAYLHLQPPLHDQYHQYAHAGEQVVKRQPRGSWKRLRLFGVNLECQMNEPESEGLSPFGSSLSGQGQTHLVHSQAHGSSTGHV